MAKMNPFEMFLKQVDEAIPYLNVEQEYVDILKEPKEVLEVAIPLKLDDGTVQIVKGWRAHHQQRARVRTRAASGITRTCRRKRGRPCRAWMSIKCATAMLPYGAAREACRRSHHDRHEETNWSV
jgi:glutamate dehydrogenase/leucine dehydrogenase